MLRIYSSLIVRSVIILSLNVVCFSGMVHAQKFERNGDIVTYRGNKFEYSQQGVADTVTVVDPVTGNEKVVVTTKDPIPTKMNGKKIYTTNEVMLKPAPLEQNGLLELFIFKNLSADLNKLPNGNYFLYVSNVVVDDKGKVVFYEYDGLTSERNKVKVPADIKKSIAGKIDAIINKAPAFKPGKVNGYTVIVRTDIMMSQFNIQVKNHKATLVRAF